MKMEDATYRNVGYGYNYEWGDPDIYHYFKYEPIKWRILNIDDEQLFLFSDEILDCQIYHPDYEHVTWEISYYSKLDEDMEVKVIKIISITVIITFLTMPSIQKSRKAF